MFGVRPDRIVVMQHGLNDIVPDHGRSRAECRARFGVPTDASVLLFFGRIRPYKGVETLLEAFGEVTGNSFLIIAGLPENASYGHRIEQMVRAHPHRERIRYHAEVHRQSGTGILFSSCRCTSDALSAHRSEWSSVPGLPLWASGNCL